MSRRNQKVAAENKNTTAKNGAIWDFLSLGSLNLIPFPQLEQKLSRLSIKFEHELQINCHSI